MFSVHLSPHHVLTLLKSEGRRQPADQGPPHLHNDFARDHMDFLRPPNCAEHHRSQQHGAPGSKHGLEDVPADERNRLQYVERDRHCGHADAHYQRAFHPADRARRLLIFPGLVQMIIGDAVVWWRACKIWQANIPVRLSCALLFMATSGESWTRCAYIVTLTPSTQLWA